VQGIYTYIPEENHVPREYTVAAILSLLFMVPISPVPALALLYFYVSTFRSVCAVPNMAVLCSSVTSWFPVMLLKFFSEGFWNGSSLLLLLLLLLLLFRQRNNNNNYGCNNYFTVTPEPFTICSKLLVTFTKNLHQLFVRSGLSPLYSFGVAVLYLKLADADSRNM
jgi:hypothetical protein